MTATQRKVRQACLAQDMTAVAPEDPKDIGTRMVGRIVGHPPRQLSVGGGRVGGGVLPGG